MAYSKFLAVLLGSQLGYSASSINKTGHGTIRIHQNLAQDEPLLHVVNKTRVRTRPDRRHKKQQNAYFKNAKNLNLDKKASYQKASYKNALDPIKTISQVTALFSNTFYNIFNFQENRPVPATTNHKIYAEFKSHNDNEIKNEIRDSKTRDSKPRDSKIRDSLKSEDSNLDQDYAAAYDDYISNVLGSDLESAVNGDGNSEYYYSDDYIDYEFDSISQIEDTTTSTNRTPEILDEKTTSNKTAAGYGPEATPHMLHPEPVVLFSIALTLFGLLQIIMVRKTTNQSGTLSCLPEEDEEGDEDDKFIIIDSERKNSNTKMLIHNQLLHNQLLQNKFIQNQLIQNQKIENPRIGQNVVFDQNTVQGETTISGQQKSRRNAKSYPISLDKIDEEPLSV